MLRIRIRDPVPYLPRDPGWLKNQDADPGSTARFCASKAPEFDFIMVADPAFHSNADPVPASKKNAIFSS